MPCDIAGPLPVSEEQQAASSNSPEGAGYDLPRSKPQLGNDSSLPGSSHGPDIQAEQQWDEDFYMYKFKVVPCPNPDEHECQDCPYAHPAEKATRRDPCLFQYTGVSCPSYRKGSCKDGDACQFAHGVFEVWLHPSRFRTELCKDAPHCTRKCCFFAHTLEQLRQVPDLPLRTSSSNSGGSSKASTPSVTSDASSDANSSSSAVGIAAGGGCTAWRMASVPAHNMGKATAAALGAPAAKPPVAALGLMQQQPLKKPTGPLLCLARQASSTSSLPSQLSSLESLSSSCSSSVTASYAAVSPRMSSLLHAGSVAASLGATSPLGSMACSVPLLASVSPLDQDIAAAGMLPAKPGSYGGGRLLQVPLDIAMEAALVASAADGAVAGGCGISANAHGLAGLVGPSMMRTADASSSMAAWDLAAAAGAVLPNAAAAGLAPTSLPSLLGPALPETLAANGHPLLASDMRSATPASAGIGGSSGLPIAAVAAQQLLALQHEELMRAMLVQQAIAGLHQEQQQQDQHRNAMWAAAFQAARDVGLGPLDAATCADCAVQQTTATTAATGGTVARSVHDGSLLKGAAAAAGPACMPSLLELQQLMLQQQQQQVPVLGSPSLQQQLQGGCVDPVAQKLAGYAHHSAADGLAASLSLLGLGAL